MLPTLDQTVQVPNTGVNKTDDLMSQLHRALSAEPAGTHYQVGASPARPDMTIAGGVVPTARRYHIIADKILIPYKDDTGPVVGRDQFLSGDVTEADLIAAGCNIEYLLAAGHIVEDGFVRV